MSFIVSYSGHNICVSRSDCDSLFTLSTCVESGLGLPVCLQRLEWNGKNLTEERFEQLEQNDIFVKVSVKGGLKGGKGGFGSLLKGGGNFSGQRTVNFDACRDLNGRRLRNVNDAKRLSEWLSQDHAIDYKTMVEEFKAIKNGTHIDRRKCRYGVKCRFREYCRDSHPDDFKPQEVKKDEDSISQYDS